MRRAALLALATVLAAAFLVGWTWSPSERIGKSIHQPVPRVFDVGIYRAPGRTDADAIDAAVAAAVKTGLPDRTIRFPAGVYELDRPIHFASDLDIVAADGAEVVLRGSGRGGITITHDQDRPLRNVTITGLTFDNVTFQLTGNADYESVVDVTLRDCVFRNGPPSKNWGEAYIMLRRTSGVTVDGCQFLRDKDHPGRGVVADLTRFTVVKDSFFGTTPSLSPSVPNGYFRTAVNVWGHDDTSGVGNDEVVIDGNVWRRTPGIGAPADCHFCQDHGLYAWGSRRLAVVGNFADGWDATPLGGTLKLRNQRDTAVVGNRLRSSGIYTYVYASDDMPEVFQQVSIRDNIVDMRGAKNCRHYCGVTYWRAASIPGTDGVPENDVFIGSNAFVSGGGISVSTPRGKAFCIQGNSGASLTAHLTAVRRSGCGSVPVWEDPFAGVHRGDFDGDGDEDFLHLVREQNKDPYWRAHLTTTSGVRVERWPAQLHGSTRASGITARFRIQVGDFNGDGRDDLAFAGSCPDDTVCWRVSLSTNDGLAEPQPWAPLAGTTTDTVTFGVHVGDFNGDGRDDLVSRGSCKTDDTCWRLLASDGESFRALSAGDGATWTSESARYGLLVGDYNGDGADDVAYRSACGNDRAACFRVHLGGPAGFTARDWGDNAWFADDGSTEHFGLRVDDVNGDGRDDIGYVGRCADGGARWRHHLSTGSGFAVECSASPDGG